MASIISLDTETTGKDLFHSSRPYIVTTCDREGKQLWWEWDVDPLTRIPIVVEEDILAIQEVVNSAEIIVFQNSKFDITALSTIGITVDWKKVRDTLLAGHLLASNHNHNLTDMCIEYLGIDILPFETRVAVAAQEARKIARRDFPEWKIAEEGDPEMPSTKKGSKRDEEKPWKADMWLCRLIWSLGIAPDQSWETITSQYANTDSAVTLPLWDWMEKEMKRRGYYDIYQKVRIQLPRLAHKMEHNGVTISQVATDGLIDEYGIAVQEAKANCLQIAASIDHELELPKGASPNDSLREMFFGSCQLVCTRCGLTDRYKEWVNGSAPEGSLCPRCEKKKVYHQMIIKRNPCLNLERVYDPKSKSAAPTLNKDAMDHYETTLEPGDALEFVKSLKGMRSRQTAVSYMEGYKRFWLPTGASRITSSGKLEHLWYRLHPNVNPTGTDTLRWSSNNPNSQNISKKESFNLRRCFGPMPGREWWSMDAKNLELRIPAYEAGEMELMYIFDHPDDAPYYGSYHLVVFDILHPELFAKHGKAVKELFESTWYQWVKNGNFAVIYGAMEKKADITYHVSGAYKKIQYRFPKIAQLSDKYKSLANRYGYVETIPDKTVCTEHGYPILASRGEDGRVLPTTPLNYHVSGTAMQWTCKAMIRCDEQLVEWNEAGWDGFLTMQVHDELVFDVPRGKGREPWKTNLPRMRKLKLLMEEGGQDISVPTPVSMEWHANTWATGMAL